MRQTWKTHLILQSMCSKHYYHTYDLSNFWTIWARSVVIHLFIIHAQYAVNWKETSTIVAAFFFLQTRYYYLLTHRVNFWTAQRRLQTVIIVYLVYRYMYIPSVITRCNISRVVVQTPDTMNITNTIFFIYLFLLPKDGSVKACRTSNILFWMTYLSLQKIYFWYYYFFLMAI